MENSKFTGTLKISKPALYIFPGSGGQSGSDGDSAFFAINGYSMLVNGGSDRVKPCFWQLVNMLQQVDSVLLTHADTDATAGLSTLFAKKQADVETKPAVLAVLGNLIASAKAADSAATNGTGSPNTTAATLLANELAGKSLTDVDQILESIERLKIRLHPLTKSFDSLHAGGPKSAAHKHESINLYYKLGQGSLDLYVLSPFANSAEYKEFVAAQHSHVAKQRAAGTALCKNVPLSHLCSAVVLLVWTPAATTATTGPANNALRLLFTGNAPQHVILAALDKMKDLDVLATPVYRVKPEHVPAPAAKKPPQTATNGKAAHSKPATNGTANDSVINNTVLTAKPAPKTKEPAAATKPAPQPNKDSAVSAKPPKTANPAPKEAPKEPAKKPEKPATGGSHDTSFSKKKPDEKPAPKPSAAKPEHKPAAPRQSDAAPNRASIAPKAEPAKKAEPTEAAKTTAASTSAAKPPSKPAPSKPHPASAPKKPLKKGEKEPAAPPQPEQPRLILKRDPKPPKPAEEVVAAIAVAESVPVAEAVPVAAEPVAELPAEETPRAGDEVVTESLVQLSTVSSSPNGHEEAAPATNGMVAAFVDEPPTPEPAVETERHSEEPAAANSDSFGAAWPNLSPVKRDQSGQNLDNYLEEENRENSVSEEAAAVSTATVANISAISSSQDAEIKDEDEAPKLSANDDPMTRSFIDDGVTANPFEPAPQSDSAVLAALKIRLQEEEVENDLNRTHELTDEDTTFEDGGAALPPPMMPELPHVSTGVEIAASEEPPSPAVTPVEALKRDIYAAAADNELIDGMQSLSFKPEGVVSNGNGLNGSNGHHHHHEEENHHQNGQEPVAIKMFSEPVSADDPSSWNLLELPKPINPNDVAGATLAVSNPSPAPAEKKSTPNGKKPISASLSPSHTSAPLAEAKTTSKGQAKSGAKCAHPVYVEVSYIPAHGNAQYVDAEFFKRVRARHYVLSSEEPGEHVLNALLDAKETWEDKNLQVSLIPTYECETIRRWFCANEENLARLKIDVTPAANLSTLSFEDYPESTCKVYKLEF